MVATLEQGGKSSPAVPTGTVTFSFVDLPGSDVWTRNTPEARQAAARYEEIMRQGLERHRGHLFKIVDGEFYISFHTAAAAVAFAIRVQHAIHTEKWAASVGTLRARIGLHTGVPEYRDGDYFGPPLNKTARVHSLGHPGQILLSLVTAELVKDSLPDEIKLLDLGEHALKGVERKERIHQVAVPFLPSQFPPLTAAPNTGEDIGPQEEMLCLKIAGQARAYPISSLRRLNLLSDELGGTPILVCLDAATDQTVVFKRRYGSATLKFQIDPNDPRFLTNEEKTIWWNMRGQPVTALRGQTPTPLEQIMSIRQPWGAWKAREPQSTVSAA